MGFGKEDFRVAVAVTSRLWNVIIQGCLRLQEGSRGCGSRDFLWLAAAALERARREEKDAANFVAVFPWYEEEDEDQDELARSQLRVEYSVSAEGKSVVTIGFPDEFAVL
ncbi:MAG: hypothetical protein DWQ31_06675 [Planctomycetota bacterium]|nr:MAG: hypothetical protein DWQ31_06675 [Planctomycetota bacterium]REJ90340.1 MAG: hypothetical protein DWQ35_16830 [Planctomycetota bacterium]